MEKLIIPAPEWEEEPVFDGKDWCGRFIYLRQGYDGEAEVDVGVCVRTPPDLEHEPKEVNGVWIWNRHQAEKGDL